MDEYIEENGLYYRVKPDGSRQEVSQLYYEYGLQAQKERERVNQVEEKQEEPTLREKYENHPIVKSMLERGWDVHVNPGADEQKRLISEGYQQSSLVGVWVKRPKLKAVKAGDFYEFIGEANANPVSEHLGISKSKTAKGEVTVGIPYHAFERNKEKLRELGFEVEIGESGEIKPDLQAKYGSQKTATAQVESESKNVGQKYSWEMSKEERASEIERLKKENASILATPLMSEGSISPYQVGSMGKQQRARWEKNAMLRMDIESKIKELESDERIQSAKEMFYAKEEEEKSLKPYLWSKDKYLEMALTKKPQSLSYLSDKEYLKFEAKRHEKSVKAAIRNREEVPVEVLNDYPQLVGTQESISKEFGVKAEVNKDITSDPLEKNIIAKDKLPSGDIYEYRVAENPMAESPEWKYQIQIKKQGGTEWDSAGMGYGKTPAEIMAKFGERYKLGKLEEVEAIDPIVKGSVQRRLQEIADKRVQEEEENERRKADYKIRTERYQKAQEEIKNIKFHKMDVTIMLRTAEGDKPEIVKGKGYGGLAITTEGEGKYKKYKITHTQSGYSVGRGFNTETNAKMALYRLQQITDWDRASDIVTSELKNSGDIKYVAKVAADPYDFSGDWVEHKSPATRIVTEKPKREIKESISMVDFGGNKYEAPIVKTVERDGIKFAQTQSKLGMGKVNDIHYWDEKEGKWLYIEQGRLSKSQLPRIIENLKIIKGEEVAEVAETKKYPPTFEGLVERAKDEGDEKYAENVIVGSKNLTKAGKEKYLQQLKGEEPTNIFEKKKPTKAEYYNWRMGGDVETPYARFLQDVSKLETAEDKRIKSIEEALPPGKEYDYGKVNPVLRNKLVERAILAKEEGVIDDRELRDFIEQHPYIKNTADWREVVSKFKGKPIKVAEEPKEPVMTEQDYEDFIKPVVKKTVEPIPIPPTEPIQAPIPTSTPITTIKAEKPIKRRNRPRKAYQEYSTAVVTYQKPEAVPYNRPEIESYIPPELPSLYEPKTVVERVETVDGEFKEIPIEEAQPPKQESRNEEPTVEAAWREVKYKTAPEGEFRQTEGARAIPSKKETKKTGRVRNWEWVGSSSNEAEAKRFAEQFSKQSGRKTKYQAQYHGKDDEGNDMITYRVSAVAIGSGLDQKLKKRKPSQYRKIAKKVVEGIYKKGKKGVETTGRMIGNLTDVSGTIPKYIPPDMNIRVSGRVYEPFRYKPTHVEKMPEYGHYYRPYQPYRALNYRSVLYPTEVSRRKRRKKINRERVVEY